MRVILLLLIIMLVFLVLIKSDAFSRWPETPPQEKTSFSKIKIGDTLLDLEIADTQEKRIKGLSDRDNLRENTGLLFIFEKEGMHGIWMKNMNFPIDIAWLDKEKRIVHIEGNISPETYPKIFTSDKPSLYVLETESDFFSKNKIEIGHLVDF